MKRHDERTKAGFGHHPGLGTVRFERGILRVDLRLRLGEGRAWLQAGDQLLDVAARMPLPGAAIFQARRERKVEARFGREEAKARGQHADHSDRESIHAKLFTDDMRVGVGMLSPPGVGEDRDLVVLKRGLLLGEGASHHGYGAEGGEELRRYAGDRLALGGAGFTDNGCTERIESQAGEGGNAAAAFVVVGDGEPSRSTPALG